MDRRLRITCAVSATATLCTACLAVAATAGGLFAHAAPSRNGGVKQVENVDDYIVVHSSTTVPGGEVLSASLIAPQPEATDPATTVTTVAPPPDTPAPTPAPTAAPTRQAAPATAAAPEQTAAPSSSVPHNRTRPTWQPPATTVAPTQYEHEPEDIRTNGTEPGGD